MGFAKEVAIEDVTATQCGTPLVMAPEVLKGQAYNHKADVWSLGIVFFELLAGFTPFTGLTRNDLKNNIENGDYKIPKTLKLSLRGLDFLNCCLQFDAQKRMSWDDLVKHPYLTEGLNTSVDDQLHLSYSEQLGQYTQMQIRNNPYQAMNERNAIQLNVKNPDKYYQVYEKTLKKAEAQPPA